MFLLLDALAVGAYTAAHREMQSVVGVLASLPFGGGGLWCRTGRPWETLIACKDGKGVWTVAPQLTEAEFDAANKEWYEPPKDPFKAHVRIHRRGRSSGVGVWSPVVYREVGRWVEVVPPPTGLFEGEETAIRAAAMTAIAVMSAPDSQYAWAPAYAPWEKHEIEAGLSGARAVKQRWLPVGIVNECAVGGGFLLLFAGQPRRLRRRQARQEERPPTPITHCTECGYALTGLPVDSEGERQCPECGSMSGTFYLGVQPVARRPAATVE